MNVIQRNSLTKRAREFLGMTVLRASKFNAFQGSSRKFHSFGVCLIIFLTVAFFGSIFDPNTIRNLLDFPFHIEYSRQLVQDGTLPTPHFLYHLLVAGVYKVIPGLSFEASTAIVSVFCYMFLGVVVYFAASKILGQPTSYPISLTYSILAMAMMLVTPISLWTLSSRNLYLGYIALNVYHNPTMLLLKPLAVLVFFFSTKVIVGQSEKLGMILVTGTIMILSTLAKPNYTMCLLPALVVVALYRLVRRMRVNWKLLILGIMVPGLVTLAWQYYFVYITRSANLMGGQSQIVFAPFAVYRMYSTALPQKFVLSIMFPACVYILYFKKAVKELELNFAWFVFFIGGFYAYFLAESGPRMFHGNFVWSVQISLFILFLVSLLFLVREEKASLISSESTGRLSIEFVTCLTVFGLHLLSGALGHYLYLTLPVDPRWW